MKISVTIPDRLISKYTEISDAREITRKAFAGVTNQFAGNEEFSKALSSIVSQIGYEVIKQIPKS